MKLRGFFALCAVLLMAALPAAAHRLNETYVYFTVTDDTLSGRIEARLEDLDGLVGLDADGDGQATPEEFEAQADAVLARFADRLTLQDGSTDHPVVFTDHTFLPTPQGVFVQMNFDVPSIKETPEGLNVVYRSPFQDTDPGHLGYGLIENNTRTGVEDNEGHIAVIFNADAPAQWLSLVGDPPWTVFVEFVIHGIWHIWLGFDHVVFLVALLLPAVLRADNRQWLPVDDFRAAFINVLKIVTVFTLSHSVTLTLAGLGIVTLPVSLVEAVIALSIIVVAVMNFFPSMHRYTLAVVLVFGLFHGFGFANVLAPLGVQPSAKVIGLAAFNIGVEIGQVAIVIVLFPILFALRRLAVYPMLATQLASVVFILLAAVWFVERSSGIFWRLQQQLLAAWT
ncbi:MULTISPECIES: HupE/UreJ family protein [unclassified Meridianimarinicoccus]|uniref:HupE/UreJ family protein n=1 Tax=unclassified Meridianimarinicoccus TaxID=2923344 RepID=UPI0018667DCC|nr:HupE/UreJ family protein [Fluviibacterium sp. MJW13]